MGSELQGVQKCLENVPVNSVKVFIWPAHSVLFDKNIALLVKKKKNIEDRVSSGFSLNYN